MKTTEITFAITIRVSGNPVPYQPATGGEHGEPAEGGFVEDLEIDFPDRMFMPMEKLLGRKLKDMERTEWKVGVYYFMKLVCQGWEKIAQEALLAAAEESDLRAAE